jgi:hypothetical protein
MSIVVNYLTGGHFIMVELNRHESKVVGIDGARRDVSHDTKPLPAPLIKLRDNFRDNTKQLLRKLFDSADDALFAMADKAGTNGDQSLYFDAMRELRLQKRGIAANVIMQVMNSFNEIKAKPLVKEDTSFDSFDDLSLVQNDELELKVAVEGMVSRMKNTVGRQLNDFDARVNHLMTMNGEANVACPGSPDVLCEAFSQGCAKLDVGIKAKLVVFKLFEKFVLSEMTKVYSQGNNILVQFGVLPQIRHAQQGPANPNSRNEAPYQAEGTSEFYPRSAGKPGLQAHSGENIPTLNQAQCISGGQFDDLRVLLHESENEPASLHNSACSVVVPQAKILSALSSQQRHYLNNTVSVHGLKTLNFKSVLDAEIASGQQNSFSDLDSDVINLVSMLFEFILDDRQLQAPMKALLARLQIPILKVAIIDGSFFDRGGHPARKLLNEIASAAIGWNEKPEGQTDRLKDKIEGLVETILRDFDDNIELFTVLLADFTVFVDKEMRRGQLVEQRTKDSERGKAANDVAQKIVDDAIKALYEDQLSRGNKLPGCVPDFLNQAWRNVMVLSYLKQGEGSNEWQGALKLVKDLMWTVLPESSDFDVRGKFLKLVPSVMRRARSGLQDIAFDSFKTESLLSLIEQEHVNVLNGLQNYEEFTKSLIDDDAVADLVKDTLEIEDDFKKFQAKLADDSESVSGPKPDVELRKGALSSNVNDSAVDACSAPVKLDPSDDDMSVTNTNDSEELALLSSIEQTIAEPVLNESDPFIQQVDRLSISGWFEFCSNETTERCKLAAIIKASDKYIFVNRSGVKVAEKSRAALAKELRLGTIQPLNDGLLFDRALESVIGCLRGV